MRIASESKAFSYIAGLQVVNDGLVSENTAVFPYLKITKPLLKSQQPDPAINSITVNELLDTTSGITGEEPAPDPAGPGPVRMAERGAKNTGPLSIDQFNRFLYGYPLASVPGTVQNLFTTAGYYMIDRVVERAAKKPYWSYIQSKFLTPIGVHDAVLTRTAKPLRHAGEVTYDSTITNYSVLAPRSKAKVPCPYGGNFIFEVIDNAAVAISTQSYAKFIDKYYSPNYPTYSYWTGYMCGTSSYTAFEAGHSTYSFTFNNTVEEFTSSDPFVLQIAKLVKKLYN
jgi:CubicO group peptidase (beta-lactamase class C family)